MGFLESFIAGYPQWSYLALFLGVFIDGEAFFLTAAIFALQGRLDLTLVLAISFLGVLASDIVSYFIGRYSKNTRWGEKISKRFGRYETWLHDNFMTRYIKMAFISKYIYYVNRLTPIIAGWHQLDFKKFFKIHFAATILWLAIMSAAGKLLATAAEAVGIGWVLKRMEFVFIGLIIIFIALEYFLKNIFARKISSGTKNEV